jgi:hypothetical protein
VSGKFRIGALGLLTGEKKSWIFMEDFAIAMVEELENPRHSCERFRVGPLENMQRDAISPIVNLNLSGVFDGALTT